MKDKLVFKHYRTRLGICGTFPGYFKGDWCDGLCGDITVCGKFIDECTFIVGVSFCAPKDNFSKKRGRLISEGRLRNCLEERKSSFGAGIFTVSKDYAKANSGHIPFISYLREISGPSWYPEFLSELNRPKKRRYFVK